jgi:CHAT domain-containing protein
LQLDSDLVTLSACQTGLGRIAVGEGVVGLVRAFLFAGSRKVLASLWDVGDTATAVFMMELYRRYRQSRDLVAALSSVKRDFLRGRPFETPSGSQRSEAPFYWAAFVLHGR